MRKLLLFGPDSIHVVNFLELISGYFDEIRVITDDQGQGYEYPNHVKINPSIRNPISTRLKISKIRQIIKDFRPDVVHLHNINSTSFLLYKALMGLDIPTVATAWGSDVLVNPNRSFILRGIVKNVLSEFNYFTCDALFMVNEMQKLASKDLQIEVANFGVDEAPEYSEKKNIIYSNRLHKPLYRIDLIIQVFFEFLKKNPNEEWKLVIAATGTETERLKQLVAKSVFAKQVDFVGWVDKKQNYDWYQQSKYYISIPISDGTSVSLLEAMENGCIPILSNLPANNEWVIDGFNGIIFKNKFDKPFESAGNIDLNRAKSINKEIIRIHALKESNRKKFVSIYDALCSKI